MWTPARYVYLVHAPERAGGTIDTIWVDDPVAAAARLAGQCQTGSGQAAEIALASSPYADRFSEVAVFSTVIALSTPPHVLFAENGIIDAAADLCFLPCCSTPWRPASRGGASPR